MLVAGFLAGLVTPPPPIVTTPAAPPIVYAGQRMTEKPVQYTFDVTIRGDGATIWSGRLTTSSRGQAGFTQNLQQSFACTGGYDAGRLGSSINLSLAAYGQPNTIRVSLRYQRPSAERRADPCKDAAVTGGVELEGSVQIPVSSPVTLHGDAGLSVTLAPVQS